eukprot:2242870-Amphidinium_carterae.1
MRIQHMVQDKMRSSTDQSIDTATNRLSGIRICLCVCSSRGLGSEATCVKEISSISSAIKRRRNQSKRNC